MPKISIVVVVNNNEQNLRDCLDSIINQTHKDIEILCMKDNKSQDIMCQILQEYALNDKRIKIFATENKSLSTVKNIALDNITGEFCYFIDSDSTLVYPKLFEYSNTLFENFDIDYFCFGAQETKNHNGQDIMYHDGFSELSFDLKFVAGTFLGNKILKTSIIKDNNIRFPEEGLYENIYFSWCYQFLSKNAYFDDSTFNYYVKDKNKSFDKFYDTAIWQMYNWHNLLEFLNKRGKAKENYENLSYLLDFYTAITKRLILQEDKYKVEKLKLDYLNELNTIARRNTSKTKAIINVKPIFRPESECEEPVSLSDLMPKEQNKQELMSQPQSHKSEVKPNSSITFYDRDNETEFEIETFKGATIDYLPNVTSIEDIKDEDFMDEQSHKTPIISRFLSFMGLKK